jgi:hypothetical protein
MVPMARRASTNSSGSIGAEAADGRRVASCIEVPMTTTRLNVNGMTVSVTVDDPDTPTALIPKSAFEADANSPNAGITLSRGPGSTYRGQDHPAE